MRLPRNMQQQAQKTYRLWRENPHHPSLQFKRVDDSEPIFSVRVSNDYRALAFIEDDTAIWFWVGNHNEYEHMLK